MKSTRRTPSFLPIMRLALLQKEKNDPDLEDRQRRYDIFLSERQSLIEAKKASMSQFDSGILTLAAGGLGISLAFIDKIAPNPIPWTKYILFLSWVSFAASLLSTLYSFRKSAEACTRQIEIVKNDYGIAQDPGISITAKPQDNIKENKPRKITNILNVVSSACFFIGVLSLCCFAFVNFEKSKHFQKHPKYDADTLIVSLGRHCTHTAYIISVVF